MGTLLRVTICGAGDHAPAIARRFFLQADGWDSLMTTWAEDGPLVRFNAKAGAGRQLLDPRLHAVLREAAGWAAKTRGAFDPTVLPLTALWRSAVRLDQWPSPEEIAVAKNNTGYGKFKVFPEDRALLAGAGMGIELGAIGKGWALDQMAKVVKLGPQISFLLDFGGSSYLARGAPPGQRGWGVEIRDASGRAVAVLSLHDEAISVSGSSSAGREIAGRKVSHIINPHSGEPVAGGRLAIARGPSASSAEVLSTVLLIVGESFGRELLRNDAAEARIWVEDGANWTAAGW